MGRGLIVRRPMRLALLAVVVMGLLGVGAAVHPTRSFAADCPAQKQLAPDISITPWGIELPAYVKGTREAVPKVTLHVGVGPISVSRDPNQPVDFSVICGPNAGRTGSAMVRSPDGGGPPSAAWTYSDTGGTSLTNNTDKLTASTIFDGRHVSATTWIEWKTPVQCSAQYKVLGALKCALKVADGVLTLGECAVELAKFAVPEADVATLVDAATSVGGAETVAGDGKQGAAISNLIVDLRKLAGNQSVAEITDALKNSKNAAEFIQGIWHLVKDLNAPDVGQIATDLAKLTGLGPCVSLLQDAVTSDQSASKPAGSGSSGSSGSAGTGGTSTAGGGSAGTGMTGALGGGSSGTGVAGVPGGGSDGTASVSSAVAIEAPLPANAAANPEVDVPAVWCASAGNCTAVGTYYDTSNNQQGLLLSETAGSWTAIEAPLPANADADPSVDNVDRGEIIGGDQLSCVSAGNCTAVGTYQDSSGDLQGLLLTETAGFWTGVEAPLPTDASADPGVELTAVSCAAPGNCTAVGSYGDSGGGHQGLLLSETAGSWTAVEAPLPADAEAVYADAADGYVSSVSCVSARGCTAVGYYLDSSGDDSGLLLTETSGSWTAIEAPVPADIDTDAYAYSGVDSVSCSSADDCTAIGGFDDTSRNREGLLLTETSGNWTAVEAPLPANAAADLYANGVELNSMSCSSAGDCTAVGMYPDSHQDWQGLLLTETSGSWTAVEAPVPANADVNADSDDGLGSYLEVNSVSCLSAGNCTAVGDYPESSSVEPGMLLIETSGSWTVVEAPAPANADNSENRPESVSCISAGNCTATGFYQDSSGTNQGMLLNYDL